jgi:hypothetical protein
LALGCDARWAIACRFLFESTCADLHPVEVQADIHRPDTRIQVVQLTGEAVEITIDHLQARQLFPPLGYYELLGEELSIIGRDPIYEEVLKGAAALSRTG